MFFKLQETTHHIYTMKKKTMNLNMPSKSNFRNIETWKKKLTWEHTHAFHISIEVSERPAISISFVVISELASTWYSNTKLQHK